MNLLILDIDETLVHASESALDRDCDFLAGHYHVYIRPHMESLLAAVDPFFEIAIWTTASRHYAEAVLKELPFSREPSFVWCRERCTRLFDPELHEEYYVKDLKKVKRRGYDLNRVVMVDDTPKKLSRNYGNLIRISEYEGAAQDDELLLLAKYLPSLADRQDLRKLEKRDWKSLARGT